MTAYKKYESLAADWDLRGRPPSLLLEGCRLLALRCWAWSEGGKKDGMSEILMAFLRESKAAEPEDRADDWLYKREACCECGEYYKLENLKLCTNCALRFCYRCASRAPSLPNGNPGCRCGGELVG